MELNQSNLTLGLRAIGSQKRSAPLSKMSASTTEESSQMVLGNSLVWMVSLPALEQLKLHWEGAPEVIKLRAQQEPSRDKESHHFKLGHGDHLVTHPRSHR